MRRWVTALDHRFDSAFGAAGNPLKQLGALGFLLLALLALSGVVLYALLETSAQGAYRSMQALEQAPLDVGTALRGLHRYGADAFVLVMLLHLAREGLLGRFERYRRATWLTGVLLLPLAYASAIGGFWLHWDRLGQFSAVATAEWLDALPLFASPLARNFLAGAVGDRLFSLLVFVHLGLPLLLVFACWAHVQRVAGARVFPHRHLAVGTCAMLLALAFVLPVHSQGPADLALAPQRLAYDWLLLFVHPLADAISPQAAWALLALVLALLLSLAFWRARMPTAATAVVDPGHCNGCGHCVRDCPFGAIRLVPHPGRRAGMHVAQVNPALCASCGICTGACPSSTPLAKGPVLATGIDLPLWRIDRLREQLRAGLAAGPRDVVFGCDCGADVTHLRPGVLALSLPCTGMLPPSFVDYALREGAPRVLVSGCREGACDYRVGQRWAEARLRREREPRLRGGVADGRWHTVWADAGEDARVAAGLEHAG